MEEWEIRKKTNADSSQSGPIMANLSEKSEH